MCFLHHHKIKATLLTRPTYTHNESKILRSITVAFKYFVQLYVATRRLCKVVNCVCNGSPEAHEVTMTAIVLIMEPVNAFLKKSISAFTSWW